MALQRKSDKKRHSDRLALGIHSPLIELSHANPTRRTSGGRVANSRLFPLSCSKSSRGIQPADIAAASEIQVFLSCRACEPANTVPVHLPTRAPRSLISDMPPRQTAPV